MDCLEGMKRIADGAVDCIISDLPYGTTACPWDSVIPFEPLWEQFKRVTKPNAAIVLFGSEPFSSALRMSNIGMYKYDWIWDKINQATGFLNAYKMPMKVHENVSVFYREQPTYNPQMRKGLEPNHCGKNPATGHSKVYNLPTKSNRMNTTDKLPISVLRFEKDHPSKALHPTQKPVDLLRYLILTYTNVGGGSSRRDDWLGHDGCGGTDGKAPLYRLRDQQGVFRHRAGSHRRNPTQPDAVLKSDKATE